MSKQNPSISETVKEGDYTSEAEKISFRDIDRRFAFSVHDFLTGVDKLDPRYNKYIVRLEGSIDDVRYEKILSYHKCNDEDYAEFYPVSRVHAQRLESFKTNEKGGLYCVD